MNFVVRIFFLTFMFFSLTHEEQYSSYAAGPDQDDDYSPPKKSKKKAGTKRPCKEFSNAKKQKLDDKVGFLILAATSLEEAPKLEKTEKIPALEFLGKWRHQQKEVNLLNQNENQPIAVPEIIGKLSEHNVKVAKIKKQDFNNDEFSIPEEGPDIELITTPEGKTSVKIKFISKEESEKKETVEVKNKKKKPLQKKEKPLDLICEKINWEKAQFNLNEIIKKKNLFLFQFIYENYAKDSENQKKLSLLTTLNKKDFKRKFERRNINSGLNIDRLLESIVNFNIQLSKANIKKFLYFIQTERNKIYTDLVDHYRAL